MKRKVAKALRSLILIVVLIGIPGIGLAVLNIPSAQNIPEDKVDKYKADLTLFAMAHQNPEGIFLEPTIESIYRGASILQTLNSNSPIVPDADFLNRTRTCVNWLWKHQNNDGGFSDVGYMGNTRDTYLAIMAIDALNASALVDPENNEYIVQTMKFLNQCIWVEGGGYRAQPNATDGDLASTYYANMTAIKLGYPNNSNVNISKILQTCVRGGSGYAASNYTVQPDITSTYYGMTLERPFNSTPVLWLPYWQNLYSIYYNCTGDSGFSQNIGGVSDITATEMGVRAWVDLGGFGLSGWFEQVQTHAFANSCQNLPLDGGFRSNPGVTPFIGNLIWSQAAITVMNWTKATQVEPILNVTAHKAFISFLDNHQTQLKILDLKPVLRLFGEKTVAANYWGLKVVWDVYQAAGRSDLMYPRNITLFLRSCKQQDGGYGDQPWENSSVFSTFCAVKANQYLQAMEIKGFSSIEGEEQSLPTAVTPASEYLLKLQNPDGGFKGGTNISFLVEYMGGGWFSLYSEYLNENISLIPASYWGVAALHALGNMSYNQTSLRKFLQSAQNVDGGFPLFMGFHSDIASTYYAVMALEEIEVEPLSKTSIITFAQSAQAEDGTFALLPALNMAGEGSMESSPTFLVTAFGAEISYNYAHQPNHLVEMDAWIVKCVDSTVGGIGDYPSFGGSIYNTAYLVVLLDDIKLDQSFNRAPWIALFGTVLTLMLIIVGLYGFLRLLIYIGAIRSGRLRVARQTEGEVFFERYPAIDVQNLSVIAGGKVIIDNVSMRLEHGEILGVLGESGAGKSTFIKALLGNRKTLGKNFVYGFDAKKNAAKLRPFYGYVPQDLSKIYENFTVMDNLITFGQQYGLSEEECLRRGRKILKNLEIESKEQELVKNLSGGQKRRVSIAIALIHQPIFCILDEPTSGLDPIVRENLWLRLVDINERYNTTLVVITHYPEESKFCHKVAIFARKRGMVDYGPPERLIATVPGRGRAIDLTLKQFDDGAFKKLKEIKQFEMVLEKRAGLKYLVFTDLDLNEAYTHLKATLGDENLEGISQTDTKMEDYFRYRMLEVK